MCWSILYALGRVYSCQELQTIIFRVIFGSVIKVQIGPPPPPHLPFCLPSCIFGSCHFAQHDRTIHLRKKKRYGSYKHLNYYYCYYSLQKKVVVEKEGVKKNVSFRKILLNKCQKEFEREKSVEKTIHEKLEDLTKQGLSVSTNAQLPCNKTLAG